MTSFYIGTSGYNYNHWRRGVFYPNELRPQEFLSYYQRHFNCVELNVTFYRLPQEKTFSSWYNKTLPEFRFVVKGSRYITHIKRLKETESALKIFSQRCKNLKEKLLCVLWQLPPSFKKDKERIEKFIHQLKKNKYLKNIDQSVEFRHPSWLEDEIYSLLKEHNVNMCFAHSPNFSTPQVITSDFLYLRFHGGEILYGSEYSLRELKKWALQVKMWLNRYHLKKLYAFFNNDAHGFAVKNAKSFHHLLEKWTK